MSEWYQPGQPHLATSGLTGSGKSVLGKQLHSEINAISIYFDTAIVCGPRQCGPVSETLEELKNNLKQGKQNHIFRPHYDEKEASQQLHQIINLTFQLGDITGRDFYLTIDEAHEYQDPTKKAVKKGRNHNLKVNSITQTPGDMDRSILMNSHKTWIGGYSEEYKGYFQYYNFPLQEIQNNGKHTALIMDKTSNIIDRVKAKEKYTTEP
jgi:hypothetical protein